MRVVVVRWWEGGFVLLSFFSFAGAGCVVEVGGRRGLRGRGRLLVAAEEKDVVWRVGGEEVVGHRLGAEGRR